MRPTNLDGPATQQVAQPAAPRERQLEMQRVETPHDGEVDVRHRLWRIVHQRP